jgi:hypothetical protein
MPDYMSMNNPTLIAHEKTFSANLSRIKRINYLLWISWLSRHRRWLPHGGAALLNTAKHRASGWGGWGRGRLFIGHITFLFAMEVVAESAGLCYLQGGCHDPHGLDESEVVEGVGAAFD